MWSRTGSSLVELVVAMLLLELAGAAALAAVLTADRVGGKASRGAATDAARWEEYRRAETTADCRNAPAATLRPLRFPPTADRDALEVAVRCGR